MAESFALVLSIIFTVIVIFLYLLNKEYLALKDPPIIVQKMTPEGRVFIILLIRVVSFFGLLYLFGGGPSVK